jgi:rSAM/selenodomain-associated transferase 2
MNGRTESLGGPSPQRSAPPCVTGDGSEARPLSLGIVVPVFNEAKILGAALGRLRRWAPTDPVVVVNGGSTDGSLEIARRFFPVESQPEPNRGAQLNRGALRLSSDVLLFLHADSHLPHRFQDHICAALRDPGVVGGCFRLAFDAPHPLLRFYTWFTRFSWRLFHFGDQGFFVRREVFQELGGFRAWPILEDVDFLRRLRRRGRFMVLPVAVTTSARRFLRHGIVRQMLRDILLVTMFEAGVSAHTLSRFYLPEPANPTGCAQDGGEQQVARSTGS